MQVRGVLQGVDRTGGEPTAIVQLVGLGNLNTFFDGLDISHAIPQSLLVPGCDCTVEISDPSHPGDGQVVGVSKIRTAPPLSEQAGLDKLITDGAGNASRAIVFASAFAAAPAVTVSGPHYGLGGGSVGATAIGAAGFTIVVTGARPSFGVFVSWSAVGA